MAYVAPTTRSTGDLITAAIWNQDVVDNMIAVKTAVDGLQALVAYEASGPYFPASTAYTDIDATNLSFTFTPQTNLIELEVGGQLNITATGANVISYAYQIGASAEVIYAERFVSGTNSNTFLAGRALISVTADASITLKLRHKYSAAVFAALSRVSVVIVDRGV